MSTTLKGSDVYSAITINSTKMPYKAESRMAGQYYHQGRWGELGFTVSTEVYGLWNAGKIMEITLEESSYQRLNNSTGQEETVPSARLMGFIPLERMINIVTNQSELEVATVRADIKSKNARLVAMKDLNLNEAEMKLLQAAL